LTHAAEGAFDTIPDELIVMMVSLLPLRDQLQCAMVCSRFFLVAVEALQERRHLDLQPHFEIVNDRFLSFLGPKLLYLTALSLSWCGAAETDAYVGGAGAADGAIDGALDGCGISDGDGDGDGDGDVVSALQTMGFMPSVTTKGQSMVSPAALQSLAIQLPYLQTLRLSCCRCV
jgi:hypothetical protein